MNAPGYGTFIADSNLGSVELPAVGGGWQRRGERNYSMEDPSFPLDDPSVWSEGSVSASGQRVSPRTLLKLPAALQAVERISGDVARCPLEPWEEAADGTYKPLRDDPLYRLTAIQPNREQDFFHFWQQVMVYRLIWRNAYIFIAPNAAGGPAELLALLPDRTKPKRADGVLYYETMVDGRNEQLPASRVMHLRGITFDNLGAIELCKMMQTAIGLALAQMNFAAKVQRAGGRRGGVLEVPPTMTKNSADKLEEGFRKKYEQEGEWFRTIVLREGSKFHDAQMSLRDSQSIEGREESARDVARAFNIRPGHLGVETSGVYGNKSDDTRDYLDMTLRPYMTGIQAQARIKLLPLARQARTCFGHNTDELLQMSVKEEFEAYGAGVEHMLITPNEGRGKLGFPSHPDGNKLASPNTVSNKPGGNDKGGTPPAKRAPGSKTEDEGDEEYNIGTALELMLNKTLDDVVAVIGQKAERAAAKGDKFIAWLDGKFPAELDSLVTALSPVGACIEAVDRQAEWKPGGCARATAKETHHKLSANLQAIASTKSPAELRTAVTTYFKNWRTTPCPSSNMPPAKAA